MTLLNRLTPAFAALMALVATAHAQEPPGYPLLGDGRRTVPPRTVEAVRALVRTLALPADSSRLWLLDAGSSRFGDHAAEPFRVSVYFWPQVFTPRLVRGSMIECTADLKDNPPFPGSPVSDGWALMFRQPSQYAFVAPPDRPFTASGPFGKPFTVHGEWTDEDLLAAADAMERAAPDQKILSVKAIEAGHAGVTGQGKGKNSKGRYYDSLEIEFQKDDSGWHEMKRTEWVY